MPTRRKCQLGSKTRNAKKMAALRAKETPEQKQQRLQDARIKATARRAAETPEERENRLGKLRARVSEKRKRWMYERTKQATAKQGASAKVNKNQVTQKKQFQKKSVAVNGDSSLKSCSFISNCSSAPMPVFTSVTLDYEPVIPYIKKRTDVEAIVASKSNITDGFSSVLLNACTIPIDRQVPSDSSKSQLNMCETSTNAKSAFSVSDSLTASAEIITPDEVCITEEEPVDIVCEVDVACDSLDPPNS